MTVPASTLSRASPTALPPAATSRFQPPAKPAPWRGIRSALTYGPICPVGSDVRTGGDNLPHGDEDAFLLYRGANHTASAEDCLRLNVWTPGLSGTQAPFTHGRRPVMVWMHGGGFTAGSGHDLLSYDGENLARRGDVVVITHNHRLNAFGYLDLASVGGQRYASSANVGMLDIVAVLEWVRDNAAAFGGDPGNVTVFGQSGGGGKVSVLMAMPAAKGLFHKAIVQSGSFLRRAVGGRFRPARGRLSGRAEPLQESTRRTAYPPRGTPLRGAATCRGTAADVVGSVP